MDNRIKKALYILIIMGIVYMGYLLLDPVTNTLSSLFTLLSPFFFGFGLAFVLHNIVDFLVRKKVKRVFAVIIVILGVILFGGLIIVSIIPLVIEQMAEVVNNSDTIAAGITDTFTNFISRMGLSVEDLNVDWNQTTAGFIDSTYQAVINTLSSILDSVTAIVLTPILLIYFLYDYDRIRKMFKKYLTDHNYTRAFKFFQELENLLSRYVGGLLIIMFTLSVVSFVMFTITGLDNALLFGFIIGVTNLIPLFGNIIGGGIAILFALTESTGLALIIAIEVIALTFLESNFVTPFIQSQNFKISPLVIILGITIFGFLFGFIGILLAIPLIVTVKLLFKHFRMAKKKS